MTLYITSSQFSPPRLAPSRSGLVVRVTSAAVVTLDEHSFRSAEHQQKHQNQYHLGYYKRDLALALTLFLLLLLQHINSSRSSNIYEPTSSLSSSSFYSPHYIPSKSLPLLSLTQSLTFCIYIYLHISHAAVLL